MPASGHDPQRLWLTGPSQLLERAGRCHLLLPVDEQQRSRTDAIDDGDGTDLACIDACLAPEEEQDDESDTGYEDTDLEDNV